MPDEAEPQEIIGRLIVCLLSGTSYIMLPCTHNTFHDRSFTVAGPRIWNSLPAHLHDEDITYNNFGRALKAFWF